MFEAILVITKTWVRLVDYVLETLMLIEVYKYITFLIPINKLIKVSIGKL